MNDPNGFPGEGRKRRRVPGTGAAPSFSAARGAALVALAVIVGIVLLNAIDDGNDGQVGDGGSTSTTTTTVFVVGGPSTTTTTKAPPRPPAEVSVRVFNSGGAAGSAGTLTNTLKAKGYKTLVATNGAARTGTVVYAIPTATPECTTLATLVPGSKVQPMPDPAPPGSEGADCVVLIGS